MADNPGVFNINALYDKFRDMSRSNLFYVEIGSIGAGNGGDTKPGIVDPTFETVKFLCKAAQVPSLTAGGAVEVPIMNRKYKLSGDPTFEDVSLTIMNDQDYKARKYFEEWFSIIHEIFAGNSPNNGASTRIVSGEAWDYMRKVTLHRLDRKMQPIMDVSLMLAFPTSVDSIDLGWENSDQIDEFTVNIAYTYPEFNYNPTIE